MEICISEIKDVAQAFQGFATGLAILVGGGWALYRFSALDEIKSAKLELSKKENDLLQQPVIDLSIKTESKKISDNDGYFIEVGVTAKNKGNKNVRLAYEDDYPLSVYKVVTTEDGHKYELVHNEKVRKAANPNSFAKATGVRAGQSQEIPFFVAVKEPGLYFVAFRVVSPKDVREHLESEGLPEHRILSWVAKSYVFIEPVA